MSLLRQPPLHFLILGGLLFGCSWFVHTRAGAPPDGRRDPIQIGAAQAGALRSGFVARFRAEPTAAQYAALLQDAIDEEILVREARRLGLDRGDASIRQRLIRKMRTLSPKPEASDDELASQALGLGLDDDVVIRRLLVEKERLVLSATGQSDVVQESEITAWFKAHQSQFASQPSVDLHHVFISGQDEHARSRAIALLAQLRAQKATPDRSEEWSAPFPSGLHFLALSRGRLAGQLGAQFASAVESLPPGQWSGPVASPFGYHLVWWKETAESAASALDAARPTIVSEIAAARARERFLSAMEELRRLYPVQQEALSAAVYP